MQRGKEALIALNVAREKPGTILDVLQERGWKPTIVDLEAGEAFPSPKKYGALIVMGGPPSVNLAKNAPGEATWMKNELDKVREALDANVGFLGVCLGAQALAKAAGGEIITFPHSKQVGLREANNPKGKFYSVQLTAEGKQDPLFKGLGDTLPVFHLQGEAVQLTPDMQPAAKLLAKDKVVPTQVFKVGERAYGTQGHFELTPQMLDQWLAQDPDLLALGKRDIEQVRADFQKKKEEYTQTGRTIFNNFLNLLS